MRRKKRIHIIKTIITQSPLHKPTPTKSLPHESPIATAHYQSLPHEPFRVRKSSTPKPTNQPMTQTTHPIIPNRYRTNPFVCVSQSTPKPTN